MAEEKRHAWNDTHHYSDTTADRRAAELGLFKWMGLLSGRWARHHSDHRYYFNPDGTNIATPQGKLKAQDRHFCRLKSVHADLTISPKPQEVAWNRDQFNNHFAIARFSEQSDQLGVVSNIRLDHVARRFFSERHRRICKGLPLSIQTRRVVELAAIHFSQNATFRQFFFRFRINTTL